MHTLKFERVTSRGQVPDEIVVTLNPGWTLQDAGCSAVMFMDGRRISGGTLATDELKQAFSAVVFSAAAFDDAHAKMELLEAAETKDEKLLIFTDNPEDRANIPERRRLEQDIRSAEKLYLVAVELFFALFDERPLDVDVYRNIGFMAKASTMDDTKRDVLVN